MAYKDMVESFYSFKQDLVEDDIKILMHPDTLAALKETYNKTQRDKWDSSILGKRTLRNATIPPDTMRIIYEKDVPMGLVNSDG